MTLLPKSICPKCGDILDAAMHAFRDATPEPGDITVCLKCGYVMAFSKKLRLRELTKAERRLTANDPKISFLEINRRIVMAKAKH